MANELTTWPADSVARTPLASIALYAKNARIHTDQQIEQIANSIREFGFVMPVLLDEKGELIAGHGRVLGAIAAGLTEVPAMVARGWTARQIKAYRIADNKLALNAAWDVKLLAAELTELKGLESLVGFSADELVTFLASGNGDTQTAEQARKTLAERFGLPPFTVLNAREGWWQDRKRAWIALGIQSEIGRGDDEKKANGKTAARTFGQDLMKGEHIVGDGKKGRMQ